MSAPGELTGPAALEAPFWAAAAQGRLVIQRCATCSTASWPPLSRCGSCDGGRLEWSEVPAVGTVWSYAIYHRSLDPRLAIPAPYAALAVELPAGVVLPGLFQGDLRVLRVGLPLEATFGPLGGGVIGPLWSESHDQR